jgi:MbtH protein
MFDQEALEFIVLTNHEVQYSLWPNCKPIPAGWNQVFGPSDKAACCRYVDDNWTDMRPLSLQQRYAAPAPGSSQQ